MIQMLLQISFFKTIFFNLKYFGIKGLLHRYAIVSRKTSLRRTKGKIVLKTPKKHCLMIGFGHNELLDYKYERSIFYNEGTIVVMGSANLNQGFRLFNRGTISFGDQFVVTGNSLLACAKHIEFGSDCLISWGVSIMDTDFHAIVSFTNKNVLNEDKEIIIGEHCWICSNVTILKGTVIPNCCVVGSGSIVSKRFDEENAIIIGNQVTRKNISWNH